MRAPAWAGLPSPASDTEARSRLLDAARRCFERFGTEKTSITDIAAEAGVTRRTVYRYFDSSDELLRAAFALAAGGIQAGGDFILGVASTDGAGRFLNGGGCIAA